MKDILTNVGSGGGAAAAAPATGGATGGAAAEEAPKEEAKEEGEQIFAVLTRQDMLTKMRPQRKKSQTRIWVSGCSIREDSGRDFFLHLAVIGVYPASQSRSTTLRISAPCDLDVSSNLMKCLPSIMK